MHSKILFLTLLTSLVVFPAFKRPGSSFSELQLKNRRVATARSEKDAYLQKLCAGKGISYPVRHIFIRAFKQEAKLELWAANSDTKAYKLLKTYNICTVSGAPGPKRREGDLQTPEGFYRINDYNPESRFYLSLGISYPNASDKIKSDKDHPGGAIYIHGNCVSIGCMPIEDEGIKELYWLAVQARAAGHKNIEVHIFPFRMGANRMAEAKKNYGKDRALFSFWKNLQPGYDYFEKNKKLPAISVDKKGNYVFGD